MPPRTGRALFPQLPAVTPQMKPRPRRNGGLVTTEPSPATAEGGGDLPWELHRNSPNQSVTLLQKIKTVQAQQKKIGYKPQISAELGNRSRFWQKRLKVLRITESGKGTRRNPV